MMNIGTYNVIGSDVKIGENVTIGNYCMIEDGVEIGDNTLIKNFVELRKDTKIGKDCKIDSRVSTSGDCIIGDCVTLRYSVIVARKVEIEDKCFIAPQVMFNFSDPSGEQHPGTIVGAGSFIGTNSTIHHGVRIHPGTIVGAKSFVNKDITEPGIYMGVPAVYKKKAPDVKHDLFKPFGWVCQLCGKPLCHANTACPVAVICDTCGDKRRNKKNG